MSLNYTVSEYRDKWGVYLPLTKCHILYGEKEEMQTRCNELNTVEGYLTIKHPDGAITYIHVMPVSNE